MTFLTMVPYLPSQSAAVGPPYVSIAAPNATAMSPQQAANKANALLHAVFPEAIRITATTLCVCLDTSTPAHQHWLVRFADWDPDAAATDYYGASLFIDAITGALLAFSLSRTAEDKSPLLPARGKDTLNELLPAATESLEALLAAASAGQTLTQPLTVTVEDADAAPYYDATLADGTYRVGVWPDGAVRLFNRYDPTDPTNLA